MAIRFSEVDARPMGRNTSGVKGIQLARGTIALVGMVVADPEAAAHRLRTGLRQAHAVRPEQPDAPNPKRRRSTTKPNRLAGEAERLAGLRRSRIRRRRRDRIDLRPLPHQKPRRQGPARHRTDRNGPVIGVISVRDDDELLMMTARGKIQRVAVREISIIGRNTQGVRIMSLDEGDTLAAIVRVPPEELQESEGP